MPCCSEATGAAIRSGTVTADPTLVTAAQEAAAAAPLPDMEAVSPERQAMLDMTARIASGVLAEQGKFPYSVSISYYGVHGCGGTMISPRVAVTAAHCVWDTSVSPPVFRNMDTIKVSVGRAERTAYQYRVDVS